MLGQKALRFTEMSEKEVGENGHVFSANGPQVCSKLKVSKFCPMKPINKCFILENF